jgi:excisionase family DNA binding protein
MSAVSSPRWVSVAVAADFLSLPKKSVYSLLARGRLPAGSTLRVGRSIRVSLEKLAAGLVVGTPDRKAGGR